MYIYTPIYTHTHIYIFTHTHIPTYTHTHTCIYTYIRIHIYKNIHMYIHIHIYPYIYRYTHMHIYAHTHIHISEGPDGFARPTCGRAKGGRQCWLRPFEWAGLPRRERLDHSASQITSPLNGPAKFLKRLHADVCELASSVGRELRAHSGLRRMET